MNERLITCSDVSKHFTSAVETLVILRGLDFTLERGECASITGPSGCGKSTFLSILGGLDRPTSGSVMVDGIDLAAADETSLSRFRAASVGFVFQFHYLLKDFTALENVMLPRYMLAGDRREAVRAAQPLLETTGLAERLHHLPSMLSGGERQRVAIARALINEPHIILADEPTGNLDRASARLVEDMLFELVKTKNLTLLLVTHDPAMAARADRRFTLQDGILIEQ